jgi:hypothetical protein
MFVIAQDPIVKDRKGNSPRRKRGFEVLYDFPSTTSVGTLLIRRCVRMVGHR